MLTKVGPAVLLGLMLTGCAGMLALSDEQVGRVIDVACVSLADSPLRELQGQRVAIVSPGWSMGHPVETAWVRALRRLGAIPQAKEAAGPGDYRLLLNVQHHGGYFAGPWPMENRNVEARLVAPDGRIVAASWGDELYLLVNPNYLAVTRSGGSFHVFFHWDSSVPLGVQVGAPRADRIAAGKSAIRMCLDD